jgi:transcription factor IIIB subunit 2
LSTAPAVEYRRDADGFIIPPKPVLAEDGNSDYSIIAATQFGETDDDGEDEEIVVDTPTTTPKGKGSRKPAKPLLPINAEWQEDEMELEDEISEIMNDPLTMQHAVAYMAAQKRAAVHSTWALENQGRKHVSMEEEIGQDEFADDPEVANCVLSLEEILIKESIWNHYNQDWMRRQQEKVFRQKLEQNRPKQRRNRKKRPRIGEGQTSPASSAGDAAVAMLKERGFSKRINYDAIRDLFPSSTRSAAGSGHTSLAGSVFGENEVSEVMKEGAVDVDEGEDEEEVYEGEGGGEDYEDYGEYDDGEDRNPDLPEDDEY